MAFVGGQFIPDEELQARWAAGDVFGLQGTATGSPLIEALSQGQGDTADTADTGQPSTQQQFPGTMSVKMPDGSTKTFTSMTPALDYALQQGGKVLDQNGAPMIMSQFQGGWLANNQPLNVVAGQAWMPGQQQALHAAGIDWTNPNPTASNPPYQGGTGTPLPTQPNIPPQGTAGTNPTPLNTNLGGVFPDNFSNAFKQVAGSYINQGNASMANLGGVNGQIQQQLTQMNQGAQYNQQTRDALIQSLLFGGNSSTGNIGGGLTMSGDQAPIGQLAGSGGSQQFPGTMSVRMPDGSLRTFTSMSTELDAALQAGGNVMDESGKPMTMSQSNDGWLANNQPLNVVAGLGWYPGQKEALANAAPGSLQQALQSAYANMNSAPGLDRATMVALNQQAVEGPQRDYQQQVQALKSQLGSRGAYGGGQTPGDLGAILGGYAPLLTARDTTREGLMQNTTLANQQQMNTNLALNRQSAANAMGIGAGLIGTIGNTYNPNAYLSGSQNALSNLLSGVNAQNQAGFTGLTGANSALENAQASSAGSFANLLKSALLSNISSAGKNLSAGLGGG